MIDLLKARSTGSVHQVRQSLRYFALSGLALVDAIKRGESNLKRQRLLQVVMFHHVYDHEERSFRDFLLWFREHYRIVSYSEAVQRVKSGDLDRPYGAITFDDGLKSIVPAAKIMSELGIPGCFFVCPGIIGETDPAKLRRFCHETRMDYESDEFANWHEIEGICSAGHEIGSHTVNHPELYRLSSDQIAEEIGRSREILIERIGKADHFAWPYGRFEYLGEVAATLLGNTDYQSSASGQRGCHGAHSNLDTPLTCLRRDNLEANWPLSHIRHFLLRNARSPVYPSQWWPIGWDLPHQVV